MLANWPWVSHFSCLFQGIWDSFLASGSSTSATCGFCVAQPTRAMQPANSRKAEIVRLGIRASINDSITRLHLDATRQAVSKNITNRCRRFNRRNANFSNNGGLAQHQHFGIRLYPLAIAQIDRAEIVAFILRQHGSADGRMKP